MIVQGGDPSALFTSLRQGSNFSNGGYWNGTSGIISTAAAAHPPLTALGMELNSSGVTAFDGVHVQSTDVLIKYTFIRATRISPARLMPPITPTSTTVLTICNPTGLEQWRF